MAVVLLGGVTVLAATNPTKSEYEAFLDEQLMAALQRMEQGDGAEQSRFLRDFLKQNGRNVIHSLVVTNTRRDNYVVLSRFETSALNVKIVMLAIGGRFFPLEGQEEIARLIGRLAL
ncbi:MAG TPA: DUF4359 domain-containing protein [Nitrospirales bacterium]|nr:DUF4359 domain-containing protein [Nitrospirales bacterium]